MFKESGNLSVRNGVNMKESLYKIFKLVFKNRYDKDVVKLKDEIYELRKEKVEKVRECEQVRHELMGVKKRMSALDNSRLEDEVKVNELIAHLKECEEQIEELNEKVKNLQSKNKGLTTQIKNMKEGK